MTPEAALIELLGRVGARLGESVTVSTEELSQWPTEAVAALKLQGLLLKARPAKSVVCPGCEQECSMPVHTRDAPERDCGNVICGLRQAQRHQSPVRPSPLPAAAGPVAPAMSRWFVDLLPPQVWACSPAPCATNDRLHHRFMARGEQAHPDAVAWVASMGIWHW